MAEPLRDPRVTPAIFVDILIDEGPVRVWSGTNNRRGGPFGEDHIYIGRRLVSFPKLVQLADAKFHRTDIELWATSGAIADLFDARASEIKGAPLVVSFAVLKDAQPHPDVAFPLWQVRYVVDTVGPRFEDDVPVAVISAATATARRRSPVSAFWTHIDQSRNHPGDKALEYIADLNEGRTKVFKAT